MSIKIPPVTQSLFFVVFTPVSMASSACDQPVHLPCVGATSTSGPTGATSVGATSVGDPAEPSTSGTPSTTMPSEGTTTAGATASETSAASTSDATGSDEGFMPDEPCDGVDNDGDGQIDEGYDLDGDGVARCCDEGPLFVTRGPTSTEVFAWMHEGPDACSFSPALHPIADTSVDPRVPTTRAIGDFDEDGSLDVIYSRYDDVAQHWDMYIAVCDGEWHSTSIGSFSEPYYGGGDLDGDGHIDLLALDLEINGGVAGAAGYTALGSGVGTFPTVLPNSFDPSVVVGAWSAQRAQGAADVTCDGVPDYVVYEYATGGPSSTEVHMVAGVGDGTFAPSVQVGVVPSQPQNTGDLGDINGDGYVDWVGGPDDDGDRGSVQAMLGGECRVGGVFSAPFELVDTCDACAGSGSGHGRGVALLNDWDQDGDLDLLTSRAVDTGVSAVIECWDNDGSGSFPPAPELVVDTPELMGVSLVTPLRN